MSHRIGIDLGTTNSAAAYTELGKQRCVKVEENRYSSAVLPSCVGLGPDGRLHVGTAAQNLWEDCVREFKRHIGTDMTWQLGGTGYTAVELSAFVLKAIKEGFERKAGDVAGAVITVPANYCDRKRHETKEAGRIAGLNVLRIINEPSAAAIAYATSGQELGENVLVIDWGGGTLDVSLVDSIAAVLDIKSNDGDAVLGGKDADAALFAHVTKKYRTELGEALHDPVAKYRLLRACEEIKIHLSTHDQWDEPLALKRRDGAPLLLDVEVTRQEFEACLQPLVDRVLLAAERCLQKNPEGSIGPTEVTDVILVGGSCLIPLLQREVERIFGKKGRCDIDPMEVVALGAAYQAEHAFETGSTVVVHSLATSLGVRVAGFDAAGVPRDDLFTAILPSTTKLPARQHHTFGTCQDNQTHIQVEVFETDGGTVRGLDAWDVKSITGLQPAPAGSFPINIVFDYNVEQVLQVTVEVPDHGIRESWKPHFLHRLESGRDLSQFKVDTLYGAKVDGLRDYVKKVQTALATNVAPKSRQLLIQLREALENEEMEKAQAVREELAEMLFDEGVSLE